MVEFKGKKKMFGVWPVTASKPKKLNFFHFLSSQMIKVDELEMWKIWRFCRIKRHQSSFKIFANFKSSNIVNFFMVFDRFLDSLQPAVLKGVLLFGHIIFSFPIML